MTNDSTTDCWAEFSELQYNLQENMTEMRQTCETKKPISSKSGIFGQGRMQSFQKMVSFNQVKNQHALIKGGNVAILHKKFRKFVKKILIRILFTSSRSALCLKLRISKLYFCSSCLSYDFGTVWSRKIEICNKIFRNIQMRPFKTAAYYISPIEIGVL